jgi:hypothetical protein
MEVSVSLSKSQLKKLAMGHPVQLSARALSGGQHTLVVHPLTHKKLMRAKRAGKGTRIMLSREEIEGSGIMDVLKGLYEGGKKVFGVAKKIYEPFKPVLAPILKQATQNLAEQGISKLGAKSPFAADVAKQLTPGLIDLAGQKTGAFGMRQMRGGALYNFSPMLAPVHPAMQSMSRVRLPDLNTPNDLRGGRMPQGGSFRSF